jgi:hypothetical protein
VLAKGPAGNVVSNTGPERSGLRLTKNWALSWPTTRKDTEEEVTFPAHNTGPAAVKLKRARVTSTSKGDVWVDTERAVLRLQKEVTSAPDIFQKGRWKWPLAQACLIVRWWTLNAALTAFINCSNAITDGTVMQICDNASGSGEMKWKQPPVQKLGKIKYKNHLLNKITFSKGVAQPGVPQHLSHRETRRTS